MKNQILQITELFNFVVDSSCPTFAGYPRIISYFSIFSVLHFFLIVLRYVYSNTFIKHLHQVLL